MVDKSPYRPIRDYAIIGNGRSAALVASNGSIDWCCWPQFDSPAVFCRLLDAGKGGFFRIGPKEADRAPRSYVKGTNVLTTTFTTDSGQMRLTDLMPVVAGNLPPRHRILRLIEGLAGEVECEIIFRPTFDFARANTAVHVNPRGAVAQAGNESLALNCPAALVVDATGSARGTLSVAAGDRWWLSVEFTADADADLPQLQPDDAEDQLASTLKYWREWSAACSYSGPYHDLVRRSALTLKLLTFEPSGALIAAPTTSLPEEIGGIRNWDYRYTWLRDSALILDTLQQIGYHEESIRFFEWLEDLGLCLCGSGDLQIMYTVDGNSDLPEITLDHLEGYRASRPVRIGNLAASQRQLDAYGAVLDVTSLCYERMPRPVHPQFWQFLRQLADRVVNRWHERDHGIWEIRDEPRHYVHSKVFCWLALDRAIGLAEQTNLPADLDQWRQARDAIRQAVLAHGYNEELGMFTQAFDGTELDASVLTIPLVGFLPATDPRVISTIKHIEERLVFDGLVYRYLADDGLPGGESTFALCSFWLVDNLALIGRTDEARRLFERVCGYANDVGLLAEEVDPKTGELLGNFPQGFTHLGLIRAALHISEAEAGQRD